MNDKRIEYMIAVKTAISGLEELKKDLATITTSVTGIVAWFDKATKITDKYENSQRLLNRTFGEGTQQMNKYIKSLANMVGATTTDISRATSLFGQMSTSLGMNIELATEFSQALDDLSARISIMTGEDFSRVSTAVLGAMKGEVRTLASLTGIVVKSGAQQNLLDTLGLNVKVSELNSANQAMLKYLVVAKQIMASDQLMGEYAESVAYQKKVLKQQVEELSKAFGSLLYPVLKAVLPVINGIIIAVRTLVEMLAGLFGYTDPESKTIDSKSKDIVNLGNAIEQSGNKARKGLRGFDKLNNITTPTTDTSSLNAGVYSQLYDEMKKIDDKMLDIKMKATEISEQILKWLGFGKDVEGKWHFVGVTFGTILGTLVGTGGIVLLASRVVGIFKTIKNVFNGFKNLDKISKALSETNGISKSASGLKLPSFKTVLKGLGELTLVITALGAFVLAVGGLTRISGFNELMSGGIQTLVTLFKGLGEIMIPLIAFNAMVTLMGMTGWAPIIGDLTFITGIIAVGGVVTALGAIFNNPSAQKLVSGGIETLVSMFKGLGQIMVPLIAFNAMVTLMGTTGFAPFIGEGAFVVGVIALTGVVSALGLLADSDGAKTLISGGIDLLVELGSGLGRFAGALVGGLIGGVSEALPIIGTNLSKFAENGKSFFEITSDFSSDTALGVKYLAEALLEITRANVLEGVANFFTLGFTGKSSFAKFGEEIEAFAPHFKKYAEAIDGVNPQTVKESANSAKSLAELAKNLPNSGGWKDAITGSNDIDKWGEKLPKFGTALKEYSENVTGLKSDVITNSVNSAKALSELAKNLPNDGGIVSWFTGDNSIDKWGEKVANFGKSFKSYADTIEFISIDKVNAVSASVKSLVDMATTIKEKGVTNTLKEFGDKLKTSSNSFNTFFTKANGQSAGKNFGEGIASGIVNALKNYKYPKINLTEPTLFGSNTLKSFNISVKANGGFVDSGEMFIARENGLPEMVGRIGSHTAVANNDQIVEGIASGVARANMATQKDTTVVIEANGDTSGLLDFINFKQKERDRQYGF